MLICLIPVLLFMGDWKVKAKGIEDGTSSFHLPVRIISPLRSISGWLRTAVTRFFRRRTVRTPTSQDQEEQPINNDPYADDDAVSMTI